MKWYLLGFGVFNVFFSMFLFHIREMLMSASGYIHTTYKYMVYGQICYFFAVLFLIIGVLFLMEAFRKLFKIFLWVYVLMFLATILRFFLFPPENPHLFHFSQTVLLIVTIGLFKKIRRLREKKVFGDKPQPLALI